MPGEVFRTAAQYSAIISSKKKDIFKITESLQLRYTVFQVWFKKETTLEISCYSTLCLLNLFCQEVHNVLVEMAASIIECIWYR